jgi:pimeloyl-ACP methyl ester carboxylesterase
MKAAGAMRLGLWIPDPLLGGLAKLSLQTRHGSRRPPFLSPADHELLRSAAVAPKLKLALESAFRQGVRGVKREWEAFLTPWSVNFGSLPAPVTLWHGLDDRLVPAAFSERLAGRIPGAKLELREGEGHYTLPLRRTGEILAGIG